VSDKLKQRVNEARKAHDDHARKLEKLMSGMRDLKPQTAEWKKAKAEVDDAKAEHGRLADEYAFAAQAHSAAVGGKQMGPQ
jgi:uncharacterized coiled-coil DUF342 family protein